MDSEQRFQGGMSEEYTLIHLALPHFEELQGHVGTVIAHHSRPGQSDPLQVLEIGCGDGVTSSFILAARRDLFLTALDNEEEMIKQASERLEPEIVGKRCNLVCADAVDHMTQVASHSIDIVASALTLHNMQHTYRHKLHHELFRVLSPGGLFVNADKYAPQDDGERFDALEVALSRFFEAFIPLGKYDLLKDWVLHNVADQGPDRVMKELDTIQTLRDIGFVDIQMIYRHNMEGVLVARKTG